MRTQTILNQSYPVMAGQAKATYTMINRTSKKLSPTLNSNRATTYSVMAAQAKAIYISN